MSIAALILAAGASTRMGRPKALLDYRGTTFVENIINTARAAAVNHIVVAVSSYDDKIKKLLHLHGVELVHNAEPETAGPLGSIRAGVQTLINQSVEYAMIWPVDHPHVRLGTIVTLRESAIGAGPAIILPTRGGRRGHPVVFGRSVFHELLQAPDSEGARFVVRRLPERVLELPVDDPAVVQDIDTPEDYDELISSTKSLL